MTHYLAAESAGQCGPCRLGMPETARRLTGVLDGQRIARGGPRPDLCNARPRHLQPPRRQLPLRAVRPGHLPWAERIDAAHRPADTPDVGLYHPTFLYESLWCLAAAALLIWAERQFHLTNGRLFALYVAVYTVGRARIEALRVDHANHILGLRLNTWICLVLFLAAVLYLHRAGRADTGGGDPDRTREPDRRAPTAP